MTSKEKVLQLLKQHREEYLSGEWIAGDLGLSRNSVWKAINALRKSGYEIEAVTNRGYRLLQNAQDFSAEAIASLLLPQVPTMHFQVVDSIASTNQSMKEAAIAGAPHGSVLIASHQTHGNAHHFQSFDSPKGGIYMSVLLRPAYMGEIRPKEMTKKLAEAVCQAIRTVCDSEPTIRGINDIFIGNTKVCGILTESVTDFESGEYQWIVVGVGLVLPLFPNGGRDISKTKLAAAVLNGIYEVL